MTGPPAQGCGPDISPGKVRIADPGDVDHLPAIERSAGRTFLAIPELAWIATDDVTPVEVHAQRVASGTTWVAEADGRVMGFLSAERVDDDLHVWELSVHFDWQGRGWGRALMRASIEHAHRAGLSAVTLTTFRSVPWNAPFYQSVGFEIAGADLPVRLTDILRKEADSGLPVASRCAMILRLSGRDDARTPGHHSSPADTPACKNGRTK